MNRDIINIRKAIRTKISKLSNLEKNIDLDIIDLDNTLAEQLNNDQNNQSLTSLACSMVQAKCKIGNKSFGIVPFYKKYGPHSTTFGFKITVRF